MDYLDKDYLMAFANEYYIKTHRKSDGLLSKKCAFYKQGNEHSLHFQLSIDKYSDNIISFYFQPNSCIYEDENNGVCMDISHIWEKYRGHNPIQDSFELEK